MKHATPWLAGAFFASLLAIGLAYWTVPYNKVEIPGTLFGAGLGVTALASLALVATRKANVPLATFVVGAAAPAAVMLRVIVDCTNDPTSHNLWPFEVAIAAFMGYAASTAGALLGAAIARFRGRPR